MKTFTYHRSVHLNSW